MATPHECSVCIGLTDSMVDVRFDALIKEPTETHTTEETPLPNDTEHVFVQALGRLADLGVLHPRAAAGYRQIDPHDGPKMSLFVAPFKLDPGHKDRDLIEAVITRGERVSHYLFDMTNSELLVHRARLQTEQKETVIDTEPSKRRITFRRRQNLLVEMMPIPPSSAIVRNRDTPPVIEETKAVNGSKVIKRQVGRRYKNRLIDSALRGSGSNTHENVESFLEETSPLLGAGTTAEPAWVDSLSY